MILPVLWVELGETVEKQEKKSTRIIEKIASKKEAHERSI